MITVYRCNNGVVQRQVLDHCCLRVTGRLHDTNMFCLIAFSDRQSVFPGDRILPGEGPEVIDWERFIPSLEPELLVVTHATPYYFEGNHHHTEAGN